MTEKERVSYLIRYLAREKGEDTPQLDSLDLEQLFQVFRSYCNIRPATPISDDFLEIQDAYLSERNQVNIIRIEEIDHTFGPISLYHGDITSLEIDAIVNAANSDFLGCFQANHNCIDNLIQTKAGIQLRLACKKIIDQQGRKEPVGQAKLTPAYNLPCRYVFHTVGPYVAPGSQVSPIKADLLASSYRSCLQLADQHKLKSLAFCSISTGVFGFPKELAAKIAVTTVQNYLKESLSDLHVIFDVFSDKDWQLYHTLLKGNEYDQ